MQHSIINPYFTLSSIPYNVPIFVTNPYRKTIRGAYMGSERALFELLKEFSVYAGKLALPYYGKISSTMKSITIHEKIQESPVTALDHGIQELLLAELMRKGFSDVAFNGEEETHLKFFFRTDYDNGITVHCDPIDGTRSFSTGKNRFCTGYTLSRAKNGSHDFFASVVYNPIDDKLFWSYEDSVSKHPKQKPALKTFASRRCLNEDGVKKLLGMGYTLFDPGNAHLAIIDVALGNMGAFLHWPIHVHDALVPFSFAKNYGVFPTDEKGESFRAFKLKHTPAGFSRIPRLCYFANSEIRDEIIPILQNKKYLL